MLRGLYTSALGMTTQMQRMDVLSNNLANVNTTAYKKDTSVTSSFDDVLAKRTHDIDDKKFPWTEKRTGNMTLGVYTNEIFTDFAQGNLTNTLGTLDVAIVGQGFITVNTTDMNGNVGEKYTRDGAFVLDKDGYLVTKDGGRVQGATGDIKTDLTGNIVIEKDGQIVINGEYVDTIKMKDFEDLKTLRKLADNYYIKTDETREKPFTSYILQGSLETSNVNTVREMVDLITVNRAYEANAKVVQAIDSTLQKSVTEIGRK